MKSLQLPTLMLAGAVALAGCHAPGHHMGQTSPEEASFKHGIHRHDMDTSCAPGKDFYQYANGSWAADNPIPPEYSSWGVGREVNERNQKILQKILEDSSAKPGPKGETRQMIGDLYASGMDEARIASLGAAPLKPTLDKIDALQDSNGLIKLLPELQMDGVSALFGIMVEADPTDSSMSIAFVMQDGAGLPDKEYYTKTDAESVELRAKYQQHISNMMTLLWQDRASADAHAETVMR